MTTCTQPGSADLVGRARDGEAAAFGVLYDRLAPDVQRFLANQEGGLGRHHVEDAVQETFLRLHRLLPEVDPARPLRPYALGVARRVGLELGRRVARRQTAAVEPDSLPGGLHVPDEASRLERERLVRRALAALDPEPRAVLVLRLVNGLGMQELADSLSCSLPTARARLREATAALTIQLERLGLVRGDA